MFDQAPYECRVEWGERGAREAAKRGDIVIVVDVLSFSSTVVTALHHGAVVFPHAKDDTLGEFARRHGAHVILGRAEAATAGVPTLSPVTYGPEHAGRRYALCSLNGAVCARIGGASSALLVGSLLNASAAAGEAARLRGISGAGVTVVACGEKWSDPRQGENVLRPSLEDYLGAGAILQVLGGSRSPEAEVCAGAFRQSKSRIAELVWDCGSGRELREKGYAEDVRHCARLDRYATVPRLHEERFVESAELA
ncbi:2-phosphosulfolactate phosphatase [Paenibacillus hemerocallicola]|uniref:Probable 2-phosphosulfolactate phosphatase n=1 Tax=Paenibacillus hemerocallicola TaxID=1172614 RepID=A0A5C4T8K3_9BACL|nr:2-phosphosulfolactate phosphatase [Paenibacillus hemerocallicola]TNJ65126.1 2-phosphosulfolactate phosphatase [Paenibacillus hemerocallicola]